MLLRTRDVENQERCEPRSTDVMYETEPCRFMAEMGVPICYANGGQVGFGSDGLRLHCTRILILQYLC